LPTPAFARNIVSNWKNPIWWQTLFVKKAAIPLFDSHNKGVEILSERWENLIILDACRYDEFREYFSSSGLMGRLEHRVSGGSSTPQFLRFNFKRPYYDDLVYVTANPWVDKLMEGRFHALVSVWKSGWDERNQTVMPETTFSYAVSAKLAHPRKRLIIHFIQPHHPFIGINFPRRKKVEPTLLSMRDLDYQQLIANDEELREAHKRNLEQAMPYVERLLKVLPGRTVVTSDHGEALGEWIHPLVPLRVYGHIDHIRIKSLVKVPWLIVNGEVNESRISIQ
jgi:hypothetical protein